jgi:hypothetical protein
MRLLPATPGEVPSSARPVGPGSDACALHAVAALVCCCEVAYVIAAAVRSWPKVIGCGRIVRLIEALAAKVAGHGGRSYLGGAPAVATAGNRQDERREGSSSSEPPSPESGSYGVTTEL